MIDAAPRTGLGDLDGDVAHDAAWHELLQAVLDLSGSVAALKLVGGIEQRRLDVAAVAGSEHPLAHGWSSGRR